MAFASVAATNQGNDTVNSTSHTVNLPSGIASGHLLIVAISMDGNTTLTWPAGWTTLSGPTNSGGDGTLEVRYRVADGTEGSSISITTAASEACSYITWRITGWHGTSAPEAGTPGTGSTANPDPPSVTASWGSDDNLFLVILGWGASNLNISGYPSNYSDNQITDAANNGGIGGIAAATRNLASDTDNPGTFTLGATTWVANTIVIRPAAAGAAGHPASRRLGLFEYSGGLYRPQGLKVF